MCIPPTIKESKICFEFVRKLFTIVYLNHSRSEQDLKSRKYI